MREQARESDVLVLGGGPAGAAAALALRDAGLDVCVVDSAETPGGRAKDFACKATDRCLRCNLCAAQDVIDRAFAPDSNIELLAATRLERIEQTAPQQFQAELTTPAGPVMRTVRSVLVATGFTPFDPSVDAAWQYADAPNVITGLDLETMLADGQRALARPGDGQRPKRLAFVQCVGSRSESAHRQPFATDYCSAVCCGYALRSARLLRHLHPDIDITVFYMDIQRFGQDFDDFLARAQAELQFIKARPWQLTALPDGSVRVDYEDPAAQATANDAFDMVCLSVGMRPASDALALADTLDLAIEADGFFRVRHGSVGRTDREGIYLAGSATGPMDLAAAMAAGRTVAAELLADTAAAPAKPAASESVLVVGGGVQALQAARALSTLGRSVTLACTEDKLLAETTGAMARFSELLAELDIPLPPFHAQPIAALARAVQDDPNIRVVCSAAPARCSGEPGEFSVRLIGPDVDETVPAAAVLLAEPAVAAVDPETLGLEMSRTVTNLLGLMLHLRRGLIPRSVAIVLDQAAQQGRMTTELVFAAARALARRGSHRIRIYAHSARVGATGLESLYRTARAAGVEVFRPQSPCRMVEQPDGAIVTARDVQGGELDEAHYDLLVLGDLVRSASLDERLATFHCRPAASQADNVWYLPVRTNRRGIWCLGAVGSDLPAGDLAAQAELAAAEVNEFLAEQQPSPAEAPDVDAEACVACLTCMRLCPHGAITFDAAEQAAQISPATCRRCGICAAECPADAISYPAADDDAAPGSGQSIACFVCENSAAQAVAALTGSNDPSALAANVQLIELPCAGRLDPRTILRMLQDGADRVVVLGCHAGACRYFDGPDRAIRRLARLQQQLAAAGIDPDRLRWGTVTAHQPQRLIDLLTATPQLAD